MSERERMYQLLDAVPDNKIAYIIGYIQGLMIVDREVPNKDTIAAFEEGDQMLAAGSGQRYADSTALFADLEA